MQHTSSFMLERILGLDRDRKLEVFLKSKEFGDSPMQIDLLLRHYAAYHPKDPVFYIREEDESLKLTSFHAGTAILDENLKGLRIDDCVAKRRVRDFLKQFKEGEEFEGVIDPYHLIVPGILGKIHENPEMMRVLKIVIGHIIPNGYTLETIIDDKRSNASNLPDFQKHFGYGVMAVYIEDDFVEPDELELEASEFMRVYVVSHSMAVNQTRVYSVDGGNVKKLFTVSNKNSTKDFLKKRFKVPSLRTGLNEHLLYNAASEISQGTILWAPIYVGRYKEGIRRHHSQTEDSAMVNRKIDFEKRKEHPDYILAVAVSRAGCIRFALDKPLLGLKQIVVEALKCGYSIPDYTSRN